MRHMTPEEFDQTIIELHRYFDYDHGVWTGLKGRRDAMALIALFRARLLDHPKAFQLDSFVMPSGKAYTIHVPRAQMYWAPESKSDVRVQYAKLEKRM